MEMIHNLNELKKYIPLTKEAEEKLGEIIKIHPLCISKYYLSLINPKDKDDPIRKMAIPSEEELNQEGEYDTSGEKENTKTGGLQHKYRETALILSTNRCATYCRFCFRKRLVGLPSSEILKRFDKAIEYLQQHKEITNVLISGGDPFTLNTKIIKVFLEKLSKIKNIKFIRFGTRIPVTFPDRILNDKSLLKLLKKYSLKTRRIYVVTHFNHPREITQKSINAIDKLINSNVIINNQTVLLKGVNDKPEILTDLMKKLVSMGINSYYLFQCRPVKRVKHHFQIPLTEGCRIVKETQNMLDGHAKRFRYIMSHKTGKIEIVGIIGNEIYLKYHQSRDPKDAGKFFKKKINKKATWLDDLK